MDKWKNVFLNHLCLTWETYFFKCLTIKINLSAELMYKLMYSL